MPGSLDELVERLRKALGGDLISVVLYGSAAAGDDNANFSDYNVLCALHRITPVQLGATESIFRWWRQQGNPSPLLLTEFEVQTSSDCFPIEFADIKAHHRILYGRDVVSPVTVDRCFYRAQVEHDLRAKLLRLRQKASGILSDRAVLLRLMVDSVSTFCVLFRHAIILDGARHHDAGEAGASNGDVPMMKRDIIVRAQERFGIDPGPFNTLLDHREQRGKTKESDPAALLARYLDEIGKVIDAVDTLEK